ncbi:MAG: hypothetical protein SOH65_10205 [Bifidobacterium sp.]|jgi:hypothetical protein
MDIIVAIVSGVFGSGVAGTIVAWLIKRVDRNDTRPTAEDITDIKAKLDRDYRHLAELDRQIHDLMLVNLRQCLFAHPRDRNAHESALESGEQYLRLGGNGVGHVRLEWLRDQYRLRLVHCDWDYTHDMEEES